MKKLAIILFIFLGTGLATTAKAYQVGDTSVFNIDSNYDYKGRQQLNATLRSISGKAYFYVADDYWNTLTDSGKVEMQLLMTNLGNEFDNRIYPIETAFFGSEPNPGIDNDSRITMLLTSLKSNVGGYFDSSNIYSKKEVPRSNEREMLYLNARTFGNSSQLYPFVAHEFQHIITVNQKNLLRGVDDDTWLNELRSEYAITLLGYNSMFSPSNISRRVSSFLENPSDSLTEWPNTLFDYGQVAIFGQYIAEHYSPKVIADTLSTSYVGIASIDFALKKNGFDTNFSEIFTQWMTANFLNMTSNDPRYKYSLQEMKEMAVSPNQLYYGIFNETIGITTYVKDWEQRWYVIKDISEGPKSAMKVKIFAPYNIFYWRMPYITENKDGAIEYHSSVISQNNKEFYITDLGSKVVKVILMPYSTEKTMNFYQTEKSAFLDMSISRVYASEVPAGYGANSSTRPTPEQFGLHEGDFIRAYGDKDIFIINQYGFKRIVLSPEICLQYGHLGARGCFDAVKMVTTEIRDAFETSPYYSNGETNDGKIYKIIEIGEDSAYLQLEIRPFDTSVFYINTREQKSYL